MSMKNKEKHKQAMKNKRDIVTNMLANILC